MHALPTRDAILIAAAAFHRRIRMSLRPAKLIRTWKNNQEGVAELRRAAARLAQGNPGSSAAARELSRILATAEVQVLPRSRAQSGRIHKPLLGPAMAAKVATDWAEAAQLNRDYAIHKELRAWCSGVTVGHVETRT